MRNVRYRRWTIRYEEHARAAGTWRQSTLGREGLAILALRKLNRRPYFLSLCRHGTAVLKAEKANRLLPHCRAKIDRSPCSQRLQTLGQVDSKTLGGVVQARLDASVPSPTVPVCTPIARSSVMA